MSKVYNRIESITGNVIIRSENGCVVTVEHLTDVLIRHLGQIANEVDGNVARGGNLLVSLLSG